ncbi:MAG: hypothetical protein ABI361_05645 [Nitrososphaera sp.]
MAESNTDGQEFPRKQQDNAIDRAHAKLASGKKELAELVESGVTQPDDRIIELRAENQQNQQVVDEGP